MTATPIPGAGATCLAFVSGKGGVGKTFLVANMGRAIATSRKTILIDLDMQNQGLSGLLSSYLADDVVNAADDIIFATGVEDPDKTLIRIDDNLWFIPAFSPSAPRGSFGNQMQVGDLAKTLRERVEHLRTKYGAEVVILDCHGGLDNISFGAFIYSDVTFVVTEVDKVTFNGTLELMDFYFESAVAQREQSARETGGPCQTSAGESASIQSVVRQFEENKLYFLVNRVRYRLDSRILRKTLEDELFKNFGHLRKMLCGLAFLPSDTLAAKSFSDYPFYLELLPESILSQKMFLICRQVLGGGRFQIRQRSKLSLYNIFERKSDKFLERYIGSPDEDRSNRVFSYTAWSHILLFLFIGGMLFLGSRNTLASKAVSGEFNPDSNPYTAIVMLFLSILFFYFAMFDRQVSSFYRDQMRYEVRLFRRTRRYADPLFAVNFLRLFFLRVITMVWAIMFYISAITYFGVTAVIIIIGIAAFK
jgi:MinD-like ATPase involved in chromosome partitioning or flagellar assembly